MAVRNVEKVLKKKKAFAAKRDNLLKMIFAKTMIFKGVTNNMMIFVCNVKKDCNWLIMDVVRKESSLQKSMGVRRML